MIQIDRMKTIFECDMFRICQHEDRGKEVAIEFKRNSTGGGGGGRMSYDDDRDYIYMKPDKFVEFTETFKKIKLHIEEVEWNFTKTFTNTRRYPLHILKRLKTGMNLKESGWLLDVKKILWNNSHRT